MNNNLVKWPDNANCAAMITMNLDAEFFWLGLSPDCVDRPKTMSMGQYGMKRGLDRVLDVLDKYGVKATFFVLGKVAEAYPEKIKEIIKRGHEIAYHGYEHVNYASLTADEQRESFRKGIKLFQEKFGVTPKGFRVPEYEMTAETFGILNEFGFKYSSSMFGDDRPYFVNTSDNKKLVEIPIQWELYDFPYFAFNYTPAMPIGQARISNITHVLESWKGEFNGYYKYGLCYVAQFEPQTIGTPGRIKMFDELLEYITRMGKVYFATGSEMADFWCKNQSK